MTSEFVFFSFNPSLNHIKIENCLLLFPTNTNICTLLFNELETDGKSFIFAVCGLTYDHVTSNLTSLILTIPLAALFCWRFALHTICLCGVPTTLETRQDRPLDYALARRTTRISAVKIICIHNKLIKSQSSHKATHFSGQLFQLPDIFRFFHFLFKGSIAYGSRFVFVQWKRRLLHKRFARKKCFCYVIQRQTTFYPHNNPPSQRNCKLLCHNNNWAIIPDPTTIERGCETDTKWTLILSWKQLIDVHQNLTFQMGKNSRGARVTGNRCKPLKRYSIYEFRVHVVDFQCVICIFTPEESARNTTCT